MRLKSFAAAALSIVFLGQPAMAAPYAVWPAVDGVAACQVQPELVLLHQGERITMRQISARTRTAARAFGMGGVAQYAVLMGSRAMYRLPSAQPTFVLAVSGNVQPQGLFTLARFEPRPNGSREVLIGGGFMSYSSGVAAERSVPLNIQIAASQSGAPAGTTLYELTPQAPLSPGEYALIVALDVQGMGAMGGIPGSYYDFGVD
jgi:hypothetical protein